MARILLAIGWAAAAILVATLGVSFSLVPSGQGGVRYAIAAFVAMLLAILVHCWMVIFLLGSRRVINRAVGEYALDPLLVESGRALRTWTVVCAVAAAAAAAVLFVARTGLAPWTPGSSTSWLVAAAAVAVQLSALVLEGRAVRRNEGVLDDVAARLHGRAG